MKEAKIYTYFKLIGLFFIYSFTGIFTKLASMEDFLSIGYLCYLLCAVTIMGTYAILWQQIIKKIPISDAYMFKGTGLIFALILSHFIFGEEITLNNMFGSSIIICGIALNSKV